MSSHVQQDPTFVVVVNGRGQYSIWPARRAMAPGWRGAGMAGTQHECLAWIEEVWSQSGRLPAH
ncbi:MAG TPA: MbtH family NRPS accessory protein [Longimicrobiaceae bacterium]|nr:MbtH family NRPS accessory protein [Longimicrobiaceae bacterium]